MNKEVPVSEGFRNMPIRPIYLVSCGYEGKRNIISVGMFAFFSSKPCLVGIGIARSRYSYELISKSKEYVVNAVDEKLAEAVKLCGEKSGKEIDKFKETKLTAAKAAEISAPLIAESPVNIECQVVQEIDIGDHVWFIGEVKTAHVREGFDGKKSLLMKWVGEDGFYHQVGKVVTKY